MVVAVNYVGSAQSGTRRIAGGRNVPGWIVSGNHIITANGVNVQLNGDAAWSIMAQVSYTDAQLYIDDRAAKGVNALLLSFIEHKFTDQTPAWKSNAGHLPFNTDLSANNPDFTDPNELYWSNVDAVINYCKTKGITVFAVPCYVGYQLGAEGWATVIQANGTTRMTTYGQWLGTRYRDFTNLVWVIGGDNGPVQGATDITAEVNALASGILTNDPNHLMTAHSVVHENANIAYGANAWFDFNTAYEYNAGISADVRTGYNLNKPITHIEGRYGNEGAITDLDVMREMYLPILHGAIGHFTGSAETWAFSAAPAASFADIAGNWKTTLNQYGAQYLTYVNRLQTARDLPSLPPDYSNVFVTAGKGVEGASYSPAVADSSQLVAFCNAGAALTVDLSQFVGTVNARWFSPIDGTNQNNSPSTYTNTGSQVFTPPTAADWVLLIDLVSLGLGVP